MMSAKPSLPTSHRRSLALSTVFSGPHTGGALRDVKCEKEKKKVYKAPTLYSFFAADLLFLHSHTIHQFKKKRKKSSVESSMLSPLFAPSHNKTLTSAKNYALLNFPHVCKGTETKWSQRATPGFR